MNTAHSSQAAVAQTAQAGAANAQDQKTADDRFKGLKKLRYILFLAKPSWKYGKLSTLGTLFTSAVLSPLSAVAATLLPKAAIDAVMPIGGDTNFKRRSGCTPRHLLVSVYSLSFPSPIRPCKMGYSTTSSTK